jgi:hypothetical protein
MRWWRTPAPLCVATSTADTLKLSSHMSSLIHIPAKQQPVINRLHDAMTQAVAYAAAIADNAVDDGVPLPMDLVDSFAADYERIISSLITAATVK